MVSTVEAVQRELVEDGFVLRYRTADDGAVDGLVGPGGRLLGLLVLAGGLPAHDRPAATRPRALFERLLALRNDLGLLSEEYDPVLKRLVGNFPQAFSHVSLVNSACRLSGHDALATGGGRPQAQAAWSSTTSPMLPTMAKPRRKRRSGTSRRRRDAGH